LWGEGGCRRGIEYYGGVGVNADRELFDDFITALPLGDIVTADMHHQAEIKLEKEKAALLEESQHVATAEESVDEELENDESVAVDTSDVGSEHGHENQTETADAVSQVDNDAVLESAKRSPTSS